MNHMRNLIAGIFFLTTGRRMGEGKVLIFFFKNDKHFQENSKNYLYVLTIQDFEPFQMFIIDASCSLSLPYDPVCPSIGPLSCGP